MNPYKDFVDKYVTTIEMGKNIPLGGTTAKVSAEINPKAPKILIFSPHPDDESIVGGLPLRLLKENGTHVYNVAVTLGSKKERQRPRLNELKQACSYLGFELIETKKDGLSKINMQCRDNEPETWTKSVEIIQNIITNYNPTLIVLPHPGDSNSTHKGTHYLVMDALTNIDNKLDCYIIETEFWGAMTDPNLMVEISPEDLSELITAISFHKGEVERNPYHISLPAWMQDNVRRGSEIVGGQGGNVPNFHFATIYKLLKWENGSLISTLKKGKIITRNDNLLKILK